MNERLTPNTSIGSDSWLQDMYPWALESSPIPSRDNLRPSLMSETALHSLLVPIPATAH